MIKITAKKLSEYFGIGERTAHRYAQKNGGLKDFDSTIKTILELGEVQRKKTDALEKKGKCVAATTK